MNDHKTISCGIIVLAGGASERLGKPKQALLYKGSTLLQHSVQVAMSAGVKQVVVVLGANADQLLKGFTIKGAEVVINRGWKEGMASSIRTGLHQLLITHPSLDAVLLMVCDQPFITAPLLKALMTRFEKTGKTVIATGYENVAGSPALFGRSVFASLFSLKGDKGAKGILTDNPHLVDIVDFPQGAIDIDTESDYENLLRLQLQEKHAGQ